jgi:uncharacterized protein YciI
LALFVMTCIDKPGALEARMAARPDHLAYVEKNRAMVKLAGPLLDEAAQMAGSLFIMEAESKADIEAFAAADPYGLAGVFARTDIRGWRVTVGALP